MHVVVVWEFCNGLASEPANFNRPVKKDHPTQLNPAKASQSNFLSDQTDLSYLHCSTGSEHNSYRAERPQNSLQKRLHQWIYQSFSLYTTLLFRSLVFLGMEGVLDFFFFFFCFCFFCVCVCMYRRWSHYGGPSGFEILKATRPREVENL
jgi:hypothetical protein